MIHIKQDGTGDFTSVQAALDSLPADNQEPVTLFYPQRDLPGTDPRDRSLRFLHRRIR